ncbi:VWA domain-containing protein [Agreia sp. VKM Ac-1783]|uniref:VWA domain-containing protein n=1 Tax=Agreia sp. VKM Ac-1783 TaxID=1938889 RepID=UPI000A2AD387|nr:VWA domain-containing protein [Agreia sp. VKM Ac-1783]SMQ60955.1 hypothetical protein SAMN06295943_0546 [Agreia sp. VKM Ac-1783]
MTPLFGSREHPLDDRQRMAWESAQALWGVHLHDPELKPGAHMPSFAWFSFPPQVVVDPSEAERNGVGAFYESIFAHEIGHHVLSPSTRVTSFALAQQMARAIAATGRDLIPEPDAKAQMLSNLWSDMLINVRVAAMQRQRDGMPGVDPEMIRMWGVLSSVPPTGQLWWVVLRSYEILWSKPAGFLCPVSPPPRPVKRVERAAPTTPQAADTDAQRAKAVAAAAAVDARIAAEAQWAEFVVTNPDVDAGLLAETVRTFGDDPVSGALRFGMLLAPYLTAAAGSTGQSGGAGRAIDGGCAGQEDGAPPSAGELEEVLGDPRLREVPEHPAVIKARGAGGMAAPPAENGMQPSAPRAGADAMGQGYGVAETLELYSAADPNEVIAAWYITAAKRWVKPLTQPASRPNSVDETIPGALEQWSIDDEIASLDWSATLSTNPTVIPGVTTRLRAVLPDAPPEQRESVRLDIYIDSSGSMRAPRAGSPAVLAGTILILSVLRGGGRVRVTSFSGPGQVAGGARFTRDRAEALRDLTFYFGGGTTFPLDVFGVRYRDTRGDKGSHGAVTRRHVVVLSDDGLRSMFGTGQEEYARTALEVRRVLDSGTLIVEDRRHQMAEPAAAAGYDVEYIDTMDDAPAACARLARRLAEPRASRRLTPGGRRG